MFKKLIASVTLLLVLTGCKSTLMTPAEDQQRSNVAPGQSQITFMRSSFVGQAIQASVFDVTSGTPEFIGIISNDTQLAHDTKPGEHTFMVVGESADFLKADLLADKAYYSIVTPRMGFWKARFSLHPVRSEQNAGKFKYDSKKFKEMIKDSSYVVTSEQALNWANKNAADISKKLAKYLPAWNAKDPTKQAQATLLKTDHL